MFRLVNHPSFILFIFAVIGMNTVTLSLEIYNLNTGVMQFSWLDYLNFIFFSIFALEVIVKIFGFGLIEFYKDKFNLFDTFVVVLSLLEIIIASGSKSYSSLRAFRLVRIFKIFRVGSLRILVDCLTKTLKSIYPFVIWMFLFMYIFTLMGMQFFAGNFKFNSNDQPDSNGQSRRYNFDNFWTALLSVFIIFTGENWNGFMYDGMRSTGEFAWLYFIMVITVGNIIILQLLVAIVISNFDDSRKISEKRKIIDEIESYIEDGLTMSQAIHKIIGKVFIIEDIEESGNIKYIKITRKRTNTYSIKGNALFIN